MVRRSLTPLRALRYSSLLGWRTISRLRASTVSCRRSTSARMILTAVGGLLDLARHVREQLALVGNAGVAALVHIEPDRIATSASLGSSGIAVSVLSSKCCVGGPGRRA